VNLQVFGKRCRDFTRETQHKGENLFLLPIMLVDP